MKNNISIIDCYENKLEFKIPDIETISEYKLLHFLDNEKIIIGYVIDDGYLETLKIHTDGRAYGNGTKGKYDLTPIKPKWYEDKDMLGKYAIVTETNEMFIVTGLVENQCVNTNKELKHSGFEWCDINKCRPATKQEIDSLYYNKES